MSVYQAANGQWIYFDGVEKHYATTEGEAQQMSRESQFITEVRAANRKVWDGLNELRAFQREFTALDYGNTLDEGTGDNAGITAADVQAVVFTTANAFDDLLSQGHATNMAKLL